MSAIQSLQWTEHTDLPPMNTPRSHAACVLLQDSIIVIGGIRGGHKTPKGIRGGTIISSVELLKFSGESSAESEEKPEWKELPSLPQPRFASAAVSIDQKIYLVGGEEFRDAEGGTPNSCNVRRGASLMLDLDNLDKGWRQLPSEMKHYRATGVSAARVMKDCLVVMGGLNDRHEYTSSVELYHCKLEQWFELPELPTKRCYTVATSLGKSQEFVMVTGGSVGDYVPTGILEMLDLSSLETGSRSSMKELVESLEWKRLEDMPTPRYGCVAMNAGPDVLLVAGGATCVDDALQVVELFDKRKQRWSEGMALRVGRRDVTGNSIVVESKKDVGGGTKVVVVGGRRGDRSLVETMESLWVSSSLSSREEACGTK